MAEATQTAAFRELIATTLNEFISMSEFGEPLKAMASMVKRAFELELNFIIVGITSQRPDESAFASMIEPLSGVIREIQEFRDRNRHVEQFFNHLSTISESIVALSWISVKPAPVQFVLDMRDAGQYYGNRVLATNKGNQKHSDWINKWNEVLLNLSQYVRKFHLQGFDWGVASQTAGSMPPPPPPPAPPAQVFLPEAMSGGDDRSALLNELNQGVGITRLLKPIARGTAAATPHAQATTARSQVPAVRTYPPKFFLDGKKWRVEHQKDNYALTINNEEMSESLAMFKCENSGLEVKNKMNGVTIDNCKRSTIVLNDIISSVEAIRCERLKIQCCGHVPLISIDNCDSVQIFITPKSQDAEIISSKSTSCNVCLLAPDGDYVELAMPEQIRTVIVGRNIQSSIVEKV